jgi:hypothetical protein
LDILHYALIGSESVTGSKIYSEQIADLLFDIQEEIRQEIKQ